MTLFTHLIAFGFVACVLSKKEDCLKGESCAFLGKVDGWDVEREMPSYSLIHRPVSESWKDPKATIYLTMASYRDELCPVTLYNLYTKAEYPERITVGVVQQNEVVDLDCYDHYCSLMKADDRYKDWDGCPYSANIRMNRIEASLAKGPTWARAKGSQMLKDEEFCMQTDSHMDFVHHWDTKMLHMWSETNNEYGILSTYVADSGTLPDHEDGHQGTNGVYEVPHLCMVTLSGMHGLVRVWGTKCMRNMMKPKMTNAIWGAGLSFSKCHAERKVPYDPHTPHIFDGEEFSRAARFWTWGYDIYSPNRVLVVHNYHQSQADPKHMGWSGSTKQQSHEQKNRETNESVLRLKRLLEMPLDDANNKPELTLEVQRGRYGLGDRRTLDQLIEFSGVDTKHRQILGNRCGMIDYVPYVEHPWGPEYAPRYDEETEKFIDVRDPGSVYFDKYDLRMVDDWKQAEMRRQHKVGQPPVLDLEPQDLHQHLQKAQEDASSAARADKSFESNSVSGGNKAAIERKVGREKIVIGNDDEVEEVPETKDWANKQKNTITAKRVIESRGGGGAGGGLTDRLHMEAFAIKKEDTVRWNVAALLLIVAVILLRLLYVRRAQLMKVIMSYGLLFQIQGNHMQTDEESAIKNV